MYSGPSGQAATISTSDPNSTARPSVDSTRPSQVAPSDTSEASSTTTSSSSRRRRRCRRARSSASVAPGTVVAAGVDGRRAQHGEAEAVGRARLAGRLADLPGDVALAGRHRLGHVDRQREAVVAQLGPADRRERIAVARHLHRVGVAELAVEREHDLRRWLRQLLAVGRAALDERRLLRLGRCPRAASAPATAARDRASRAAACGREHRFGRAPPEQGSWPAPAIGLPVRGAPGPARPPGPRDTPSVGSAVWPRPRCTAATGRAGSPS